MTATIGRVAVDDPRRQVVRDTRTTGRRRGVVVGAVLAVASFVALCVSVSLGDFPVPLPDVVPALFGQGDRPTVFVVQRLRLPRALTAVLVGAAFGASGAIFQSLARNALASPDIIGITAGASLAAVVVIVVTDAGGAWLALSALVGALATALAIYVLAWRRGVPPYRLVLVGLGVGAALAALTSWLLTRAEIYDAARATVWLTGSLNGRGWEHVRPVGAALVVLMPVVVLLVHRLRMLQLGDDTACGLGVPVERTRIALLLVGVALAAVATASAGPVAFVAFVAAPVARRLVRAPLTVVPAALAGALLLLLSDLVATTAFGAVELPVGVVTGLIGGPYLIWLLARANRIGQGG